MVKQRCEQAIAAANNTPICWDNSQLATQDPSVSPICPVLSGRNGIIMGCGETAAGRLQAEGWAYL